MDRYRLKLSAILSGLLTHFTLLLHLQVMCALLTFTFALIPSLAASIQPTTESPENSTNISVAPAPNQTDVYAIEPPNKITETGSPKSGDGDKSSGDSVDSGDSVSHRLNSAQTTNHIPPREFPLALVIASSVAAFLILVFFVIAYCWHTHQLDSRAKKLAIRIAADAEHGGRCQSCSPRMRGGYRRTFDILQPSTPDQESIQYGEIRTPSRERGIPGSPDGGRSLGTSELSDAADSEDFAHSPEHERGRSSSRSSRGAHRKWSRTRKSSGDNSKRRDSAITDKAILSHFASRRHSTFFI